MVEEERKKLREQEAKKKLETGDINKADSDGEEDEEDEFKYADGADAIGQRVSNQTKRERAMIAMGKIDKKFGAICIRFF